MRPDVFDTSEANAVIRADVDHRSLHRRMWVASGGRWCETDFADQIAGHRPRLEGHPRGWPFAFWLDHGPMRRSIGCPAFRVAMEAEGAELRGQFARDLRGQLRGNYAVIFRSMAVFRASCRLELRGKSQGTGRETHDDRSTCLALTRRHAFLSPRSSRFAVLP